MLSEDIRAHLIGGCEHLWYTGLRLPQAEKVERMQEYASRVHRANAERLQKSQRRASSPETTRPERSWEIRQPSPQERSRRQRALEFAKQVPKPRVITTTASSNGDGSQNTGSNSNSGRSWQGGRPSPRRLLAGSTAPRRKEEEDVMETQDMVDDPLEALAQRHRQHQQAVQALLAGGGGGVQ